MYYYPPVECGSKDKTYVKNERDKISTEKNEIIQIQVRMSVVKEVNYPTRLFDVVLVKKTCGAAHMNVTLTTSTMRI